MKCEQARQWMLLMEADRLAPVRADDFENHLAACPDCRAFWHDHAILKRRARAVPLMISAPARTIDAVVAGAPRPRASRWPHFGQRGWPAYAAAAALLFLLGGLFGLQSWRQGAGQSSQSLRMNTLHALAGMLIEETGGENIALPEKASPEAARQALARQLLILHEISDDATAEENPITAPGALQPTTLQDRNTPAVPQEIYG